MAIAKTKRRRDQVKQLRTDLPVPIWRRVFDRFGMMPALIAMLFFIVASTIVLYGSHSRQYAVGQRTDQPIYAEVTFRVADSQETFRRQEAARASAASHYRLNRNLITQIRTELLGLYQATQASETYDAMAKTAGERGWPVDESAYQLLRSYAPDSGSNIYESSINNLESRLERELTWDPASAEKRQPASTSPVVVVHVATGEESNERSKPREVKGFDLSPFTNSKQIKRGAEDLVRLAGFPTALRPVVIDVLVRFMSKSPLLTYDQQLTQAAMSAAESQVDQVFVEHQANKPLIPPRPEAGLSHADLELLGAHDKAYQEFLSSPNEAAQPLRERRLLQRTGMVVVVLICTIGLFAYVGTYQPRILEIQTRTIALVALLGMALLVAKMIALRTPIEGLVIAPVLYAASIVAVAYSRRIAAGIIAFPAVMICLAVGGDAALLVTMFVGVSATVVLLDEVRSRERMIWVGTFSAIAVFLSSMSFDLIDGQAFAFAARRSSWGALAAVLSAMTILASLPMIERVFRIATSLTLLEWRDPTRPLLNRLASEAPGTYSHSLLLGTLAEAACKTIGANGLLAQVGALYHDIGKLHKSEYFAENQEAKINRHDNLAPTMSLLIIVGHVKDGLEMAKEYRLPRVLHQFIAEHHGTTVVRYFHHIASEQQPSKSSGKHDREVSESQFRYPGPKPKTRESAILMLCDGIEGAVRALAEPTPGRIEHVVHEIFTDRLNDGQFDDCDITLRELHRVEESLVKSLCSHYHGRVSYPKKDKTESGEKVKETPLKSAAG